MFNFFITSLNVGRDVRIEPFDMKVIEHRRVRLGYNRTFKMKLHVKKNVKNSFISKVCKLSILNSTLTDYSTTAMLFMLQLSININI